MDTKSGRSWSCYPDGLAPTRRAFLRTLAVASAAGLAVEGKARVVNGCH